MELSSEILDTIDITNQKNVLEVLKQAIAEEDIIFESEATDESVETEVEEIIEIIEEVEENEESQNYPSNTYSDDSDIKIVDDEAYEENSQSNAYEKSSATEIYTFDEENSMFKTQYAKKVAKNVGTNLYKINNKQVVAYDVDEDWQDEDVEHLEELDEELEDDVELINHNSPKHGLPNETIKSVNNLTDAFELQNSKSDSRNIAESAVRIDNPQNIIELGCNLSSSKSVENTTNHEIVKNAENNLVYTVLGSRKQNAPKSSSEEKFTDEHYIKMETLDENVIPVEGTIYYEGENMETVYVTQAIDDNEQYQYDDAGTIEQSEPVWDTASSDTNQNQDEENSQDQIFLHEDEEGQLYFKDDTGALQPVYLTEDGNYAIAENSDDQDSKESPVQTQSSIESSQEDTFIIPDLELKPAAANKQTAVAPAPPVHELDSEDNTVTISLIISEDEHGQKRTQVIIPTTDNMKCDICNKSFKTSFQLLRHNRLKHARDEDITTRNFPCDLCPKRYPDQNSLVRHRKTHTGDRPFQCLECHKNFPTSTALRRHLTLHNSQSRPLPCIYCGRRFVEKASLVKHEQSHLAGDQPTHTCDVCHKPFLRATDLSLHKKYHDPDKKFDCEVCGREFNRLNNLQRHMMVHQQQGGNEEILSCDVCGITYKFMSSLTRHMVTTHMNPEKLRQQAEEQRRKRENNYRRYLENRKMYETQQSGGYSTKRGYHQNARILTGTSDEAA